jgi:hypothetical protein
MKIYAHCFIACAVAVAWSPSVRAAEGGVGREVSGTNAIEDDGIVPPEPIWAFALGALYQDASIGAGRQVPIIGEISAGIHSDLSLTTLTGLKAWNTGPGMWNFSSSFTLPYDWNKITARFGTSQSTLISDTQQASNLFDIYFVPLTAGYHFSQTEHVSFSLGVWAPTGDYDKTRLANPSLNNWTFVPSVAFTKLFPQQGLQFDATSGLQFFTRNPATDYQNAPLLNLDLLLVKTFPSGLGIGATFGWIEQLGSDTGPTADKLHGFQGYDVSVGPYLSYSTKLGGKAPLSISLRYVPTIASKNRVNGDTVMASFTVIL